MSNMHEIQDRHVRQLKDIGNSQPNINEKVGQEKVIESHIAAIIQLRQNGQLELALKQSNSLLAKHPLLIRGLQMKGEITYALCQYQESLDCYQSSLAIIESPENVKNTISPQQNTKVRALYYYNCGLCFQKLEKHKEAIIAFKEAVKSNKQKIQLYFALAQSYNKIGQRNKAMQIFQKLAVNTNQNSQILKKIIDSLLSCQEYQLALQIVDRELLCISDIKGYLHKMMLLFAKAKSLRKLGRYEASILAYREVLNAAQEESQVIDAYFRLAGCYEKIGKTNQAAQCYQRILKTKPQSIEALNNLANLQLRQKKYAQAVLLLNSALARSKEQKSFDKFKELILKSHRIVALTNVGRDEQAARDLKQVSDILAKEEGIQKLDEGIKKNVRFIKEILKKYQQILGDLTSLQREVAESSLPLQLGEEGKNVSKLLMDSIACELQSKCMQQDELERLSQRINKLHKEILDFKINTLKDHEINQIRVHDKIQEIQEILDKKEEQTNKLAMEMENLRKEYDRRGSLAKAIDGAKANGKPLVALYAQQMYWVFSAYLVSIRLVANNLIGQGKQLVHLKGVSSFFARFKSIFEVASRIPHIGSVCDAVNSLLSLYLDQESSFVYSQLNKAITRAFTSQKELQSALEAAVLSLIQTDYIEQALDKSKKDKIQSQMALHNRALSWFHKQRTKIIKRFVEFEDETADEILIKQQVIEDIGSVLLYIIRSRDTCSSQADSDVLDTSFKMALFGDFKLGETSSLFAKAQLKEKQASQQEGGCSKCQIY